MPTPDAPPSQTAGSPVARALHEQAERARSFGSEAELYDRARPGYPPEVASQLGAGPGVGVLDVGAGTGKAGLLFARHGCEVLGIEPDQRMAAVAARRGLAVEVSTFEEWQDRGRRFDLVVSGQAWHWLDPVLGPRKAAGLLTPGGTLAPFWNFRRPLAAELRTLVDACYRRLAPELTDGSVTRGAGNTGQSTAEVHLASLRAAGRFLPPEVRRYSWAARYDPAGWRQLLATQSDHRLLGPDRLEALLDALQTVVEQLGGTVEVTYDTVVLVARTKP